MKIRNLAAAAALVIGTYSGVASAQTSLGTLGASTTAFGNAFGRLFNFGSALGAFTDYYSFNISTPGTVLGGTTSYDFGSLDVALHSLSLSGGSLASAQIDTSPGSFSFGSLGAGTYQLAVNGSLRATPGWAGLAGYQGTIHAVASPAPEPEVMAMLAVGLGVLGVVARRRKKALQTQNA